MQILQQVQNLVFTIQDEEYRVYALMTIIPQLSNEEALQQAYKAIVAIHNEEKRIQGLRKLVPQLSQELKIQALLHVLKSILVLSDNKFRHSTLIWLRPYLSEIPIAHYCTLLQEVQDEWLRANLIEILLPYLDDKTYPMFTQVLSNIPDQLNRHRAEQILLTRPTPSTIQQQLQSAAAIRDELHRTRLYSVIAHQLRPQQLFRITDYVERELNKLALPTDLASIRLYLTSSSNKDTRDRLLTIATTLVASITDHAKRVKALIQLQPYLESDEQTAVIDQAIHTVQDIKDEQQRVRLLIQLALEVALPAEGETQGSVVTSILAMDDIMTRVKLLSALITRFEGNLRRIVIRQILIDAKKLDSAKSRAQAFAIVLPYLQGDARMTAFHRATSATYAIDDPMDRVTVLVKIAEAQINRRAFDEAKSIATTQLTGQAQAKAIALLLPLATELERHALLHKGLSAAMSIQDQTQRAMVLSSYLPYVKNAQPIRKIIYSVIGNTIREKSQTAKRAELLDYLATDPLIHSAQFPEETLLAMADTIAEISNDWTWL